MKKTLLRIISIVISITIILCLCTACDGKNDSENDIKTQIDDAEEKVEEIAQNSSKVDVGKYVLVSEDKFSYETVDGGVAITLYSGEDTAIIIPDKIAGLDVVEIRAGTFADVSIVGVKLPDTLKLIGDSAFYFCTSLVEVEFGKSVVEIGQKAFEGCFALSKVKLNDNLDSIDDNAFLNCSSLEQITLNKNLKKLGAGAFCLCPLRSISIPGSVEIIGAQAFASCKELKNVTIEEGVKIIEKKAFETCKSIKKIQIPNSVVEIGIRVFNQIDDLTIYGSKGSVAEQYANDNKITFKES